MFSFKTNFDSSLSFYVYAKMNCFFFFFLRPVSYSYNAAALSWDTKEKVTLGLFHVPSLSLDQAPLTCLSRTFLHDSELDSIFGLKILLNLGRFSKIEM